MELKDLVTLIQTVSESSLTGFEYKENDMKISMKSEHIQVVSGGQTVEGTAPQVLASAPALVSDVESTQNESVSKTAAGNIVKSPLVGTFYAAPSEDAPAFVSVGDRVKKGQTLAIIEAMKLMNDIECEYDGKISEIFVQNGEAVEYGQPLFCVE